MKYCFPISYSAMADVTKVHPRQSRRLNVQEYISGGALPLIFSIHMHFGTYLLGVLFTFKKGL